MATQMDATSGIQIVITAPHLDKIVPLQLEPTETIENVKALIQIETGILLADQRLEYNGQELLNQKTLSDYGIKSNDLLTVYSRAQMTGNSQPQQESGPLITWPPKQIQEWYRSHPNELQQLLHSNPTLAEAVLSEDTTLLQNLMQQEQARRREAEMKRLMEISMYEADPLNPDLQKKIEEDINWSNINENMETAMEYTPEVFGRVVMLYIDVEINGHPIKAFVDSGAQSTIMSVDCAQRCNLMRLVDKRWAGVARGVGTAQIVGRIHGAQIKIGNSFFSTSLTILGGNQGTDLLLGLDMLRHHQCTIDLKANVLRIGDEVAPFLPEKDIPMHVRLDAPLDGDFPETPAPRTATTSTPPTAGTTRTTATPQPTHPPTSTPSSQENPLASLLPSLLRQAAAPPTTGPAQSATPQQPTPARAAAPGRTAWPEESIRNLMDLGYARSECEAALTQSGGNVDLAASILFGQGGGF